MSLLNSLQDIKIIDPTPIGEGGFSQVFKVLHKNTGKVMALKKINISQLSKGDCNNLKNEISIHMNLMHKHIIRFFGCLQIENLVFILLEHAPNNSLFYYIHEEGLPFHLALKFFFQISIGLYYLHGQEIMHRDIKTENILLDENFNVKICDFGWSTSFDTDTTQ